MTGGNDMNLTKEDLQQIGALMDQRFKKVDQRFDEQDAMINAAFGDVQKQLNEIQDQIDEIKVRLSALETEVIALRNDLTLTQSAVAPIISGNRDKLSAELAKIKKQVGILEKAISGSAA